MTGEQALRYTTRNIRAARVQHPPCRERLVTKHTQICTFRAMIFPAPCPLVTRWQILTLLITYNIRRFRSLRMKLLVVLTSESAYKALFFFFLHQRDAATDWSPSSLWFFIPGHTIVDCIVLKDLPEFWVCVFISLSNGICPTVLSW